VALLLLVSVSLIAMFFDIWPTLLAAMLSALVWNFFFIPPTFTFTIGNTEDVLMFFMYFIIALVNAALTYKIRQMEKEASKKEEKENTLKLYNTLLNSLSHELRTPISTILGATDNLQMNDQKLSQQNKEDLVSEISKASLRLDQQVENLLNMSRLESGVIKPKKDWVDIHELVHEIANRLKESLKDREVKIEISDDIPLYKLDRGLMEVVLHNLIYNASLYVPVNGEILIKVSGSDNKLVLIVEDNGPGFPKEEIEKVFEKFYRLKNSKTGGTGLGLSIVKGFVEAQGGKITLENKAPHGARFTIKITAETSDLNSLRNE